MRLSAKRAPFLSYCIGICTVSFASLSLLLLYSLRTVPSRRKLSLRAGLFTPYDLTPGGGEKYFLSSAKALQNLGYAVTILTYDRNVCSTIDCIAATAKQLGVEMSFAEVSVKSYAELSIRRKSRNGRKLFDDYDIFFSLGNSKFPDVAGHGTLFNVYMCQFPFDLDRWGDAVATRRLASYDTVVLNSLYSQTYFFSYAAPYFTFASRSLGLLPPTLQVLYPPSGMEIQSRRLANESLRNKALGGTLKIAMLGRFFRGKRQNKGHVTAIRTFSLLVQQVASLSLELILIGNLQPGHEGYIEELKELCEGLPVEFNVCASQQELSTALSSSILFWHMTGIDEPQDEFADPASMEHFGISIVEAMSYGCVPIVLSRGGVTEIVTHGVDGFIARSTEDYIQQTRKLLSMAEGDLLAMQEAAIKTSHKFSARAFYRQFQSFVNEGVESLDFRTKVRADYAAKCIYNSSYTKQKAVPRAKQQLIAVLVEGSMPSQLRYCVYNAIRHLGSAIPIQVHHSFDNRLFVRKTLGDILTADQFVIRNETLHNADDYNSLFKSPTFWASLNADKALIFSVNSVFLRSGVREFLDFDYIVPPTPLFGRFIKQGNYLRGSVSLRNISLMHSIASQFGNSSPRDQQEDDFFLHYATMLGSMVPSRRVAYKFSRRHRCSDLESPLSRPPLAVNGPLYYHNSIMNAV